MMKISSSSLAVRRLLEGADTFSIEHRRELVQLCLDLKKLLSFVSQQRLFVKDVGFAMGASDGARWHENFTRGLLSFMSFMCFGTALRCWLEEKFLETKLFNGLVYLTTTSPLPRIFGAYLLVNAAIFFTAALNLFDSS